MLTEATEIGADQSRVEVSGWDQEQIFFVEKSQLGCDEFVGKHVSLRHMLPEGAVVFVRALQPIAQRPSSPTAYKVEFICRDPDGLHQFRLNPVQPRYNADVPPVN
jgi:hypothetical protein